ncbi:MAG: V-type ATP synthase subunit D [Candidatus Woesearchaeota archaeon]|nr:V-type ATP synthase subunit D [Candidatus Woesearchaeota archaeon]
MTMADIKPTRSELIKLKIRIKLAKSGHKLLKKKRDGLILDFFEILKKAKTLRQELAQEYRAALEKINIARTLETDLKITSLAMAIKNNPQITVETKNIMGVVVPKIGAAHRTTTLLERGYGFMDSTSSIDEATTSYERVVAKVIQAAETETAMKKILAEIEKTKRRVNALEFSVIPSMEKSGKFIKLRLEEMERENVFRLKRIKK